MLPRARARVLVALLVCAGCDATPKSPAPAAPTAPATAPPVAAADDAPEVEPPMEESLVPLAPIAPTTLHPFDARDMLAMDRISGHQVSPDGKTIAFVRRVTDLANNRGLTDIWTVPARGGAPTQITAAPGSDHSPLWSPDGKSIFFVSDRSGTPQVWRMAAGGGPAEAITDLPLPIDNLIVDPTGTRIVFSLSVYPDCDDLECTVQRNDAAKADKRTGHVYDTAFVRHWDTYRDGRRSHLFSRAIDSDDDPIDLMPSMNADAPSKPFGGTDEVAISPDGQSVVFTARDVGREEAWSTNFDLFTVPIAGGAAPKKITDNPAWDTHPVFSPDGDTLVYAAMKRPGYEADRLGLMTMPWPDGPARPVAEAWDRSAGDIVFAPDGRSLWVTAQDVGQVALFSVTLSDGAVTRLVSDGTISGPAAAGDRIVFARDDLATPAELYSISQSGGTPEAITSINADAVALATMGDYEQFSFAGASGDTVYAYLVKPAGFRQGARYPIAFLIHGGPQGSFGNKFHYRWNPQAYAGAGYAALMIDFHGSTGYGQAFTDAIQKDWGGAPLEDLQKGLAAAIEKYAFIDGERVCALGASYGGFMINWIAGQWPDRFDCLINHDGVFDQRSMYFSTEELWFPEWEQGGPYYENAAQYERHNPALHVDKWQTPMLVVHGSLDYRVPEEQGLAAFNALQRRGIPSRYLHFPDENHWVLSPNNTLQWHETVLDWMGRYTAARPK